MLHAELAKLCQSELTQAKCGTYVVNSEYGKDYKKLTDNNEAGGGASEAIAALTTNTALTKLEATDSMLKLQTTW